MQDFLIKTNNRKMRINTLCMGVLPVYHSKLCAIRLWPRTLDCHTDSLLRVIWVVINTNINRHRDILHTTLRTIQLSTIRRYSNTILKRTVALSRVTMRPHINHTFPLLIKIPI